MRVINLISNKLKNIFWILLVFNTNISNAQYIFTSPTQADNILFPEGAVNAATIDYAPFCGLCSSTSYQLTAIASDDGISNPFLTITDNGMPKGGCFLPIPPGSHPDVVIGNDFTTIGNYIVGVVYTDPLLHDVYYLTCSVTGQGTGTIIAAPSSTPTLISNGGGLVTEPSRIDIAAQYSTPYTVGIPSLATANIFIITWHENGNGIFAYCYDLNATMPYPYTMLINNSTNVGWPDVAAVEVSPTTASFKIKGIFTYLESMPPLPFFGNAPVKIMQQEWITTGGITTPFALDILPNGVMSPPRIDAIDDYNYNTPAQAYYTVASANLVSCGGGFVPDIFVYNNFINSLTIPAFKDISIALNFSTFFGQINLSPSIACGPGPHYTVGYYTAPGNLITNYNTYFATEVSWNTGQPTTNDAYQIPLNPIAPSIPIYLTDMIALSASCNNHNYGQQYLNATWQNGLDFNKLTNTVNSYNFKTHTSGLAHLVSPNEKWTLGPIPATDFINLYAPLN